MCRKLAYFVIVAAMCSPALAAVEVNIVGYPAIENITSWPEATADVTTANPSAYSQAENNYGGSAPYSFAQSWTATTSGALNRIQIAISGTAPVSFKINLYDAGVWDGKQNSPTDWSDVGANTYKPGENVSKNLLGLPATWTGFKDANDKVGVLDIAFSDKDMAPITAGHQYIFEISSETDISKMIWFRNAGSETNYTGGQAFRQAGPLNGNPGRDFAMAVTVGSAAQKAVAPETKDVNEKPAAPGTK